MCVLLFRFLLCGSPPYPDRFSFSKCLFLKEFLCCLCFRLPLPFLVLPLLPVFLPRLRVGAFRCLCPHQTDSSHLLLEPLRRQATSLFVLFPCYRPPLRAFRLPVYLQDRCRPSFLCTRGVSRHFFRCFPLLSLHFCLFFPLLTSSQLFRRLHLIPHAICRISQIVRRRFPFLLPPPFLVF